MLAQRALRAAALIDARPFLAAAKAQFGTPRNVDLAVAGIAIPIERAAIDVERAIILGTAFADQPVDRRAFERGAPRLLGDFQYLGDDRGFPADVEQRIGVERFADEGFNFEVGQRQQLDRLLQLRRHDKRLRLPQIEAWTERHRDYSPKPAPRDAVASGRAVTA